MGKYWPETNLFQIGPGASAWFRAGKATMEQTRRLLDIMARLRGPGGCPWDLEQSPATLRPFVLEEAHELAEAIDGGDWGEIGEELGDLLLQIVFLARIAAEEGRFDFEEVARRIADKLIRRHPHVFGGDQARGIPEVWRRWDAIKLQEKQGRGEQASPPSRLDGIPRALPALNRARLLADKAARAGFDWPSPAAILDKVREETAELEGAMAGTDGDHLAEELGDLFFVLASLARRLSIDPEGALSRANRKFERRFRRVEDLAREKNIPLEAATPEALDQLWEESKRAEQ